MKTTDRIFAWVLLLLGCVHLAVTFVVHKAFTVEAIWFVSGGALFGIAVPWLLHRDLQQNPQVIVAAIAVAAEFGFSLRQCFR